jgi:predicted GIY-YIG superfamily endonuclease
MVYLLHYSQPLCHARHYMGATTNLNQRIKRHRNGTSKAHLPVAFFKLGINFVVSRTWEGDFELEKQLKKQKNGRRLCPICCRI